MKFRLLPTILPLYAVLGTNQHINVHLTPGEGGASAFVEVDSAGLPLPVPIRKEVETPVPTGNEGEVLKREPPSPDDLAVFKRVLLERVDSRSLEGLSNLVAFLNQYVLGSEVSTERESTIKPQDQRNGDPIIRNLEAVDSAPPLPHVVRLPSAESIEDDDDVLDEADVIRARLQSMLVEQELVDSLQHAFLDEGVSPVSILLAESYCAAARDPAGDSTQREVQLPGTAGGRRTHNHAERRDADEANVRSADSAAVPSPATPRQLSIQDIRYRLGDVVGQVLYGNRPIRRLVSPRRGPVETLLSGNSFVPNRRGFF